MGFYIIYYTLLACFWIACLVIFFQTLPEEVDGPKWQQDWGLIGNNPGVGLRPRNTDARIDSQMFVLQGNDENIHPSDLAAHQVLPLSGPEEPSRQGGWLPLSPRGHPGGPRHQGPAGAHGVPRLLPRRQAR